MKKYLVYQHFEGNVSREIEADTPEEAKDIMWEIEIELEELETCNWDAPTVQQEIKE